MNFHAKSKNLKYECFNQAILILFGSIKYLSNHDIVQFELLIYQDCIMFTETRYPLHNLLVHTTNHYSLTQYFLVDMHAKLPLSSFDLCLFKWLKN